MEKLEDVRGFELERSRTAKPMNMFLDTTHPHISEAQYII